MAIFIKIYALFIKHIGGLQNLLLLLIRLWMARVFLLSGLVKISNFSNTVALFNDEYRVPFIPAVFAAYSATLFELLCPVLLIVGLASRVATLPLLGMVTVIQLTYDQNAQHAYWALLLLTILAFGPGKLALDHLLKNKFYKQL